MKTKHKTIQINEINEMLMKIPPLWELDSYIAVNPFLGYSSEPFFKSLASLETALGCKLIPDKDLLENEPLDFINSGSFDDTQTMIGDLVGTFLSSYVDAGISYWANPWKEDTLWKAFQKWVKIDPIFRNQTNFQILEKKIQSANSPYTMISILFEEYEILDKQVVELLMFQQLGWSSYFRKSNWHTPFNEESDLVSFLAILCLIFVLNKDLPANFKKEETKAAKEDTVRRYQLLESKENVYRNRLIFELRKTNKSNVPNSKVTVKFLFCIDVRSESFRRHLENESSEIETDGFAGFFGMPIGKKDWKGNKINHSPALIEPNYIVNEDERSLFLKNKLILTKSWIQKIKRTFPIGFHYVESAGFLSAVGMLSKSFKVKSPFTYRREVNDGEVLSALQRLKLDEKTQIAAGFLKHMGWLTSFPNYILIVGHASETTNNPHEAGLSCGACSGQSGELSARFACELLNDAEVRSQLMNQGIKIEETTKFVPAIHETVSDSISILKKEYISKEFGQKIENWIQNAQANYIKEKTIYFSLTKKEGVSRSRDWSEVFPEAGLANCASFFIARRETTKSLNLESRSFLNSYDHTKDTELNTLELLLTAPAIVASWINLQYYASTVAPDIFGAGNKLIQTVVGNIGVFEGNHWNLRSGLPLQSVYDGKRFIHTPVRLTIFVEAPLQSIDKILAKHNSIRDLVEGEWVHLVSISDDLKFHLKKGKQWELIPA
ncbi:DUF2309 family protein [Leptospira ognonensis]|uniref:DUF2309 family protein n=1 Tax=Leptospira ognonensis TaxID=2484945 RepID=A0A4R9JZ27_9LEPT|nr:putative inorganic carbon transporter subunit DabA [Leptospira ognonensis]TGL56979.1 DUF2309 family protein [Leptospira ognonensis]